MPELPDEMKAELDVLKGKRIRIRSSQFTGMDPETGLPVSLNNEQGTVLSYESDGHCTVRIETGPAAGKTIGLRPGWGPDRKVKRGQGEMERA